MLSSRSEPHTASHGPSLHALVVYARPVLRERLLTVLSSLGVFVTEALPSSLERAKRPLGGEIDFAVAVCDSASAGAALVNSIPEGSRLPLLVVLPHDAEADWLHSGDDIRVVLESQPDEALASAISHLAARARRSQLDADIEAGRRTIFDDVEFSLTPPELRRGMQTIALSRTEGEILRVLSSAMGSPVPVDEIRRSVRTARGGLSDGNLKCTVLRIRKKVESIGANRLLLDSVRGFGYVLRN
jgi:DNA-binding response OmpR family regulator